jgi:peptide/nickel transport system substrate-binding protein
MESRLDSKPNVEGDEIDQVYRWRFMEISVLGPLRVTIDGRLLPLPAKQRTLLAILAFQPNRTVSADRLIAALWGEDASPTAIKTLQSHVFQMRRLLAPDTTDGEQALTIITDGRGYRLSVDPAVIDAQAFERFAEQARVASPTDPSHALGALNAALALWRGPSQAEVGDEPFAAAEIERLGELRGWAFDELVRIRLALGDYEGLIPELRREVHESPFREQLWASLMLALLRSGRKADALLAYRDATTALRQELDVDPSQELQDLAARIRDGDTSLAPASVRLPLNAEGTAPGGDRAIAEAPTSGIVGPWLGELARSIRRSGSLVAFLVVAMVAAFVAAGSLLGTSAPRPSQSPGSSIATGPPVISALTDSVDRMDGAGKLVTSVLVGAQPDAIAFGGGSAWVSDTADDAVTRLDASGSTVMQRISVGESPAGIAFGFGAVWVANSGNRTVSRIDPTTDQVVAVVPVGIAPAGIATDDRYVWVTNRLDHSLSRIDPNDEVMKTFTVGATPLGVATAGGYVWVADSDSRSVVQVDAQSGVVRARVNVGNGPSGIAATPLGDAVWVVNGQDGTVSRIDVAAAIVTTAQTVGADPTGIAVGNDGVWVAVSSTSEIVKLDPASGQIIGRYPVGASPRAVAVDAGGPLFTARAATGSHRGGTLNIVSGALGFPATADPSYLVGEYLGVLTNDALVTSKMVGGPDGQTLVPDLATSIPASPDGGRTWMFQLRAGVRYSTGALVRPSDVLGSFERAMNVGAGLEGDTEIMGASACGATPACDLSRGITFDDQAGTVTFHLTVADPGFPSTITEGFILPAATSPSQSDSPMPATGPYMVDRFEAGREVHLIRNPYFHEWSTDAQPAGYPDTIDWILSSLADPSSLVESGAADIVVNDSFSAARLTQLRTELPAQLHVAPSQKTWFEMMNTNIPPFNDPHVRQAINYAADRGAIVDAWGGPLAARITCQVIPPEYTAYEPFCPYTVAPSANGGWIGPDLKKAEALIPAKDRGARVTVWGPSDGGQRAALAQYFTGLLNKLGFKATTQLLKPGQYITFVTASPNTVQMAGFWTRSSTRSGSDMIVGAFTCPDFPTTFGYIGEPAGFCSRPLDAQVRKAGVLEATDPVAANHLWAQIDEAIVNAAPAVMAFNPTDVTFVSKRVGDYEHNPIYQVMFDQLWVQ